MSAASTEGVHPPPLVSDESGAYPGMTADRTERKLRRAIDRDQMPLPLGPD